MKTFMTQTMVLLLLLVPLYAIDTKMYIIVGSFSSEKLADAQLERVRSMMERQKDLIQLSEKYALTTSIKRSYAYHRIAIGPFDRRETLEPVMDQIRKTFADAFVSTYAVEQKLAMSTVEVIPKSTSEAIDTVTAETRPDNTAKRSSDTTVAKKKEVTSKSPSSSFVEVSIDIDPLLSTQIGSEMITGTNTDIGSQSVPTPQEDTTIDAWSRQKGSDQVAIETAAGGPYDPRQSPGTLMYQLFILVSFVALIIFLGYYLKKRWSSDHRSVLDIYDLEP